MRFTFCYFFLILTFIYSCKSQKEKEIDKLTDALKEYYKKNLSDSSASIDSFFLVKMDTLTQVHKLKGQVESLNNDSEYLLEIFKLNNSKLSLEISQLKLYEMLESRSLVDIQKENVNKTNKRGKEISAELDSIQKISSNILLQISTADSVKVIGFQAKCFYQLRLKDNSVKRDTGYIILNENKDIVKLNDWLNLPYSVSYDKFK